jgi:hypothetical protein
MPFFFVLPSQNRISIARGLAALRSQPPWPCARASPPHSLPAVELRPSPRDSSASSPGGVDRALACAAAGRISLGGRAPGWWSSASSPTPAGELPLLSRSLAHACRSRTVVPPRMAPVRSIFGGEVIPHLGRIFAPSSPLQSPQSNSLEPGAVPSWPSTSSQPNRRLMAGVTSRLQRSTAPSPSCISTSNAQVPNKSVCCVLVFAVGNDWCLVLEERFVFLPYLRPFLLICCGQDAEILRYGFAL